MKMAKETIDNILEVPEFLGILRESSKTFELDLAEPVEAIGRFGKEVIGYKMHGRLFASDKHDQPRYLLFSLIDKESDTDKKIVRLSESGGNSHLDIVGGLIEELDSYFGLSVDDRRVRQPYHNEEPTIINNESLEVKVDGGGFIYFDAGIKEIILSGKSKTFDLFSGEYAIQHQLKVHNQAKGIIENWLQKKGFRDYKVKII
jgi:hypothetical protein